MFDSTGVNLNGNLYGQNSIYEMGYDVFVDNATKQFYISGESYNGINNIGLTIITDSTTIMTDVVNPGYGNLSFDKQTLSIVQNSDKSFTLSGRTTETGNGDFFLALRDSNLYAPQTCDGMSLGPYNTYTAPLQWVPPLTYIPINANITVTDINPQVASGSLFNILCSTVSSDDLSLSDEHFSIYPNPSSGKITLNTSASEICRIYDLTGRKLCEYALSAGKNEISLNLEGGIYILKPGEGKSVNLIITSEK